MNDLWPILNDKVKLSQIFSLFQKKFHIPVSTVSFSFIERAIIPYGQQWINLSFYYDAVKGNKIIMRVLRLPGAEGKSQQKTADMPELNFD